jgi:photosystem II stability/assembly factor-like uncharacterized protein
MRGLLGGRRTLRALAAVACVTAGGWAALAGAGLASVEVSRSGWAWTNPSPQGRTLTAISFAGGVGYAVGYGGTALATLDGGHSWTGLPTGTTATLEHVEAVDPHTVVVGDGSGCVTRISEDAGQIFRRIFNVAEASCPEPVAAFSFLSAKSGFLLLKDGAVEATGDGGETFSRRTAIPGTSASSGGGGLAGAAIHFLSQSAGIAFVVDPHTGGSAAFATPDGGVSWAPVALPPGAQVRSVHFVDEKDAYAIGPNTLLRSVDGGASWKAEPLGAGNQFVSIDCAAATTCVLTRTDGKLVETTDGGETASVKTASSALIYAAGYASPTQVVAVGESGATVLSGDGGATFTALSGDIGGQYSRLRQGPGTILLAPGADGDVALSSDGGLSWQVIATQTSQQLVDAAFGTSTLGYALDVSGGLQRTINGGASWQTLSTGTTIEPMAVCALGSRTVLLLGASGVSRAVAGGPFEPVRGAAAAGELDDYDLAGPAVFAFRRGSPRLIRSTDEGAHWSAVALPLSRRASRRHGHRVPARPGVAVASVAFTSPSAGMLLDFHGRLWRTANGGRSWSELLTAGTSAGVQLAFADPRNGFLSLPGAAAGSADATVLRTSDGGATWHPQEISAGAIVYGGLVALAPLQAAALLETVSPTRGQLRRELFATSTGGDVAGAPASLSLQTSRRVLRRRALRRLHFQIRVTGTLGGAVGGETVLVARRDLAGGAWRQQEVVAGANGGSFATTWHITRSSVFVAQWAGDSGRPGLGTRVLAVTVR